MADLGLTPEGSANLCKGGCCQGSIFGQIFPKTAVKANKISTGRTARPKFYYVNPPLVSETWVSLVPFAMEIRHLSLVPRWWLHCCCRRYRPQTKFVKSIFSQCLSVHGGGGGLCPGGFQPGGCPGGVSVQESLSRGSLSGRPPRTVTCGQYASYWNAFLLLISIYTNKYNSIYTFALKEIIVRPSCGVFFQTSE